MPVPRVIYLDALQLFLIVILLHLSARDGLVPTLAGFVSRSATSARPHFARNSRAYATLAAGVGKNERAGADAAYEDRVAKAIAERTMLYVTHV